ncbi:MAG TPA: hypothetical protein VEK15_14700 [Vicinamibacteria bacterium]|nr:hypothetical protein [Vicinamibacteria bacterium]
MRRFAPISRQTFLAATRQAGLYFFISLQSASHGVAGRHAQLGDYEILASLGAGAMEDVLGPLFAVVSLLAC